MKRKWIPLAAVLLLGLPAQSPAQGSLRGQVLMPDGSTPPREIRMVLDDAESFRVHEILYTDSNGRFIFTSVRDGDYRITVTSDGPDYSDTVYSFRLGMSNRFITITLNPPKANQPPAGPAVDSSAPPEARRLYEKAVELIQQKKGPEAERQLRKALEIYPGYFQARNDLGMLYLDGKRFQEAEAEFRKALDLRPGDYRAGYNLGVALLRQQKFQDSAEVLDRVVEKQPALADAHYYLGIARYGLRDFDDAAAHLLKAYELQPEKELEALMFLGNVYYLKNDLDRAIECFEKYLEVFPEAPNADEVRQVISKLERERGKP